MALAAVGKLTCALAASWGIPTEGRRLSAASTGLRLVPDTPTGQQPVVDFLQQAGGEGETTGQPRQAVFEGRHVARDLHDIVKGNPWSLLKLEQQQV